MGQISAVLRKTAGGYSHWCPGCEEMHHIAVEAGQLNGARWSFDGNVDKPTFAPSVKITAGHYIRNTGPGNCWCDLEERHGIKASFACGICHYFIRGGWIEFCGDSTHHLSGKTVEMPPLPAHVSDAAEEVA